MSELKSYKLKSKVATAISFIAALIAYLGKPGLAEIMPAEYAGLIPVIVFAAGYVLAQSTENKRVAVAEDLIREEYATSEDESESVVVNLTLDGEDVIKDEDTIINEEEAEVVDDGGA